MPPAVAGMSNTHQRRMPYEASAAIRRHVRRAAQLRRLLRVCHLVRERAARAGAGDGASALPPDFGPPVEDRPPHERRTEIARGARSTVNAAGGSGRGGGGRGWRPPPAPGSGRGGGGGRPAADAAMSERGGAGCGRRPARRLRWPPRSWSGGRAAPSPPCRPTHRRSRCSPRAHQHVWPAGQARTQRIWSVSSACTPCSGPQPASGADPSDRGGCAGRCFASSSTSHFPPVSIELRLAQLVPQLLQQLRPLRTSARYAAHEGRRRLTGPGGSGLLAGVITIIGHGSVWLRLAVNRRPPSPSTRLVAVARSGR